MGLGEVDTDLAALLLNIRGDTGVAQVYDHIAFTQLAALEIDIPDSLDARRDKRSGRCRSGWRHRYPLRAHRGGWLGSLRSGCALTDNHVKVVAVDAGAVGRKHGQVDDYPRAVLSLYNDHAACVTVTELTAFGRQLTGHARQVQRNTRRLRRGVTARRRHRRVECQLELDAITRQGGDIQGLEVGSLENRRKHRDA